MGDVSEDAISSIIEALLILCKEKILDDELLITVENDAIAALAQSISEGEAFSDDFNRIETASALWSAIIKSVEGRHLLGHPTARDDLGQLTSSLAVHIQRLLGALLPAADLIAQENSNNVPTLVQSMRRVLGIDFPEVHLLDLFQNYRSHFPYAYMFIRRLGRTPNALAHLWEKVLKPTPSNNKSSDDSDIIGRSDKQGNANAGDDSDEDNLQRANHSDPKWLVSDSEEGEDSEDDDALDQKRQHSRVHHQKKRMTRMSASPARRVPPAMSGLSSQTNASKGAGNEKQDETSMVVEEVSFTSDIGTAAKHSPGSTRIEEASASKKGLNEDKEPAWSSSNAVSASGRDRAVAAAAPRKSLIVDITQTRQRPDSVASLNSFDDSDIEVTSNVISYYPVQSTIDIEKLRQVYQNSITAPGAEHAQKQTLSRNIRYALGAQELADEVLQAGSHATHHVTWPAVLQLAHLTETEPLAHHSSQELRARAGARNEIRTMGPPGIGSSNTREMSISSRNLTGGHSRDITTRVVEVEDKSEPPLRQPRVTSTDVNAPPRSYDALFDDPIEAAIAMFKKVDLDKDGVVTHVELVKTLRRDKMHAASLKLPSHVRQEDGSRDSYMHYFNEIDRDGTGNISLSEFLQFIESCREPREQDTTAIEHSVLIKRGGRSGEPDSPLAPANKPVRLLDPEDRRAGVQQPQRDRGRTSVDNKLNPPVSDASTNALIRSKSESKARKFNQSSGPSSTVHRRGDKGTDLDDVSGTVSPPRMVQRPTVVRNSLEQSHDSVHSGPMSAKHRRLVGGESIGNEHIPGESREAENPLDPLPPRPPLNPISRLEPNETSSVVHLAPALPSSLFARATDILFEGYLDKKSQILGLWQKRYFVLIKSKPANTHSHRPRTELRIYTKASVSAWGVLPLQLRRVVPLLAMEAIDAIPDKKKIGTLFKVVERIPSAPLQRAQSTSDINNNIEHDRNSDNGSVASDMFVNGTRIMTLRAADAESRLSWITTLRTEVSRIDA